MTHSKLLTALLAVMFSAAWSSQSDAQGFANAQVSQFRNSTGASAFTADRFKNQLLSRSIGRFGVAGVNSRSFGLADQGKKKPFQGLSRGPAVSPYLALSGSLNGVSDFYNIVRPQQEFERERQRLERERERQDRLNQRSQQAIMANEHRLNQMAAKAPFDITGDKTVMPTGHSTTYMAFTNFQSTGNYFAPMQGLNKQNR